MNKSLRITAFFCIFVTLFLFTSCSNDAKESKSDETIAVSSSNLSSRNSDGNMKVSFIDVGQGDSTLIELPSGKSILIDGGEPEYANTVIDYIESEGIHTLDYVIGTHPHSDHIGSLPTVIDHFDIKNVYLPKAQNNTRLYENLLQAIKAKGLKVQTAKAGVTLIDDSNVNALFVAPVHADYADLNNYSAVLKLIYGDKVFLFMGDAEKLSEEEITDDVKADVLKVGHHGSNYSSSDDFLKRVKPKYAVISCGAGNQYGHPDPQTLSRLQAVSAEIFRTDEMGTIVFQTDGNRITVDKKASPKQENAPPALQQAELPKDTAKDTPKDTSALKPSQAAPQEVPAQNNEVMVYITNTGQKYHRDGCQYLRNSKIPIPLSQAKQNYEPCSKCNPPQ